MKRNGRDYTQTEKTNKTKTPSNRTPDGGPYLAALDNFAGSIANQVAILPLKVECENGNMPLKTCGFALRETIKHATQCEDTVDDLECTASPLCFGERKHILLGTVTGDIP
jgi:hypothetical protein